MRSHQDSWASSMDSYTSGLKIGNKSQKPVLLSLLAFIASLVIVYGLFFSGSSTPVIHKVCVFFAEPEFILPACKLTHDNQAAVLLRGEGSASGKIYFEQPSKNAVVRITGKLTGLDPNALRGFHIQYCTTTARISSLVSLMKTTPPYTVSLVMLPKDVDLQEVITTRLERSMGVLPTLSAISATLVMWGRTRVAR